MVTTNLVQTIAVNIPKEINLKITHEQFVELALVNRDLQLERTAKGELIVMAPTGSVTEIVTQVLQDNFGYGTVKQNWGKLLILLVVFIYLMVVVVLPMLLG